MIEIKLRGNDVHIVSDLDIEIMRASWPTLDIDEQLRVMQAWCQANPKKRKTKRGIARFIHDWLMRNRKQQLKDTPELKRAASHKPFADWKPKKSTAETGKQGFAAIREAMRRG